MGELIKENTEYKSQFISILQQFRASQIEVAVKVNSEMLKFFWFLGKELVDKKMSKIDVKFVAGQKSFIIE